MPLHFIFFGTLAVSVTFGLWKGGAPERLAVAIMLAMVIIQPLAHVVIPRRFDAVDVPSLIVDLMSAASLTAIALYANRIWPLWTAALQFVSCLAHGVRLLSINVEPLVYGVMKTAPTFAVLIILIAATATHQWRLWRHGADPSWAMSPLPPRWILSMARYLER